MTDPARAVKLTWIERRKRNQKICRDIPCLPVQSLLMGRDREPPCVVCIHEAAVLKAMRGLDAEERQRWVSIQTR